MALRVMASPRQGGTIVGGDMSPARRAMRGPLLVPSRPWRAQSVLMTAARSTESDLQTEALCKARSVVSALAVRMAK